MAFKSTLAATAIIVLITACSSVKKETIQYTKNYQPEDVLLYNTILQQDSLFFSYYNSCDTNLEKYSDYYDAAIEFYHDQGGLMTSKADIVEGTKKYICGKVTRTLIKGSVEVYPIKDYGAVEIGLHSFKNKTNPPDEPVKVGRFMIIWHKDKERWFIKRVVSLH